MATFLLNAAAIPANDWPAEFSTHDDPHDVSGQWIGSGTKWLLYRQVSHHNAPTQPTRGADDVGCTVRIELLAPGAVLSSSIYRIRDGRVLSIAEIAPRTARSRARSSPGIVRPGYPQAVGRGSRSMK